MPIWSAVIEYDAACYQSTSREICPPNLVVFTKQVSGVPSALYQLHTVL